jgi:putative FmdB family regulatory protein
MPFYDYDCPTCGSFTAMRPMAQFRAPTECPRCGTSSPRQLMAAPQLSASAGDPSFAAGACHPSACACCRPGGRSGFAAEAVSASG